MKNLESVQNEVRKTMGYLDKMPQLGSNPFLYTRIQARLTDDRSVRSSREGSRVSAVVRSALLVLLVVLNLFTIIRTTQSTTSNTIDRREALSDMIDDYSMTSSSTSPTE